VRVLRNLLLLLFLLGLVAFNVSFGLRRFEWRRQAWVSAQRGEAVERLDELVLSVEREFAALEALVAATDPARDASPAHARARVRVDADGALRLAVCTDDVSEPRCVERSSDWLDERAAAAADLGARIAWLGGETPLGDALDRHAPAADDDARLRLARELRTPGAGRLVLEFPPEALVPPADWRRGEAVATVATMFGVSLGLLFAGAVFLRLSTRSFRLRETERYLRWIRRLSDRYRALMEGAADMILVVDPAGEVVRETNAAARAVLGLPAGADNPDAPAETREPSANAVALAALFDGADLQRVREAMSHAARRGEAPEPLPELRVRRADGGELLVDGRVAVVDVGDGRIAQLSLRDLSEQKAIERQLQTSERLSSLGLLTAGVAHEINNPLEGIGNYVALLGADDLPAERRHEYLAAVQHGFERIRDIVRDLLQFSRGEAQRGRIDLADVLRRALSMAAYSKPFKRARVECHGTERACPVLGDAGRLEQVLLNLLLNAARASGDKRVIVTVRESVDGAGNVELEVADEGPGIPAEHLDHIFDPFFTTEGGTGLGLSVSYGIIKAHGGSLVAANRPAGGAVFRVSLPRSPDS